MDAKVNLITRRIYVYVGRDEIANLNITWLSPMGRLSVTGYVRNVFDNRYAASTTFVTSQTTTGPLTSISGSQSDPRTYGVVFSVGF